MVEFNHVSKMYDGNITAVDDVDFKIEKGEFVFLIGPSGSGKTTIIKMLIRDEVPSEGKVFFDDVDITKISRRKVYKLRREIGVIFQDFKLVPDRTVYENVAFAMEAAGRKNQDIKETVPYVLDIVGLSNRMDSFPRQLSGGEQQRVAIARAIANNPKILIADEPTGNLDPASAWDIVQVLTKINNWGTTIIMSTHGTDIVNSLNKRVIQMDKGKVIRDDNKGQYEMVSAFEKNVLETGKSEKKSKTKKTYKVKLEDPQEEPSNLIADKDKIVKEGRFSRMFTFFKKKHEEKEDITDILEKPVTEIYEESILEDTKDSSESVEKAEIKDNKLKQKELNSEEKDTKEEINEEKKESSENNVEDHKVKDENKLNTELESEEKKSPLKQKKIVKSKKDLTWTEEEVAKFLENSKDIKVDSLDLPSAVVKDLKAAGYKYVNDIIEAGPDKLSQSLLIDPEEILMVSKSIKELISNDN